MDGMVMRRVDKALMGLTDAKVKKMLESDGYGEDDAAVFMEALDTYKSRQ